MKVSTEKLKAFRKAKGKKQEDLGALIGTDQTGFSRKENAGDFTSDEIDILCKELGVKKEQLLISEIDPIPFLVNQSVGTQAALNVILAAISEIRAAQTGGSAAKMLDDLKSLVKAQTRSALEQMKRQ